MLKSRKMILKLTKEKVKAHLLRALLRRQNLNHLRARVVLKKTRLRIKVRKESLQVILKRLKILLPLNLKILGKSKSKRRQKLRQKV
jgi:hypothetical protein